MEEKKKKKLLSLSTALAKLMMLWLLISPTLACSPSQNGEACKDCVLDQMKYGCPTCVPVLRCMARCLWGGNSKLKCIKRCDCNGGKPTLAECKKCMSRCKCSCVA